MITAERYERLRRMFEATYELPPAERPAWLDRECRDDPTLRTEIEELLAKHADSSAFLEDPALGSSFNLESAIAQRDRDSALVGQHISRFRLERVIASGGMGTVFEAVQDDPSRTVAVKVMRQGIASKSALRRFKYEAQLLGRLRHPNIAQVYEAGTHDNNGGVPYFAMEYIPGAVPITDYAVANKLTIRQRLELFIQVCDAVYHGHQKGIIHRDLKPSNILVDSAGQPKIIDFGVARSTDSDIALTTIQTSVGQLIGTLQYMSPEQCARAAGSTGDAHDIDTRSDVYALGLVLYELLSDTLPYDVAGVAIHEATRIIREQNPSRLRTINKSLGGDVETITLKALEKDRERRYHSAAELAEDIRRYLSNQPITARPPSVIYQLRTFARRNRALVGGVSSVFVLLIVGFIVSTSLYFKAEDARVQAAREADSTEAINAFFNGMLGSIVPMQLQDFSGLASPGQITIAQVLGQGRNVSVAEMLRQASARVEETFAGKPKLEATVRETMGMTFKGLGLQIDARPQLQLALDIRRRELGDDHPDTWRSALQLASFVWLDREVAGTFKEETILRIALEGMQREYGLEDPQTLTAARILADVLSNQGNFDASEPLYNRTLSAQRRVLPPGHRDTLMTMSQWTLSKYHQGKLDTPRLLINEAYATAVESLGPDDSMTILCGLQAASLDWHEGRFGRCKQAFEDGLERCRRTLGEDHLWTDWAQRMVAASMVYEAKEDEQEQLFTQALNGMQDVLGEGHPEVQHSRHFLAGLWMRMGKVDEALEVHSGSRPFHVGEDGVLDPSPIRLWQNRHFLLRRAGRSERRRYVLEGLLGAVRRRAERPGASAGALHTYARTLLVKCMDTDLHDPGTGLRAARKAVEMTDRQNFVFLPTLALAYKLTGDLDTAIEVKREALSALPQGQWSARALYEIKLVGWLRENGQTEAADLMLRDTYDRVRETHGEPQAQQVQRLTDLILDFRLYERGGNGHSLVGVAAMNAYGEHATYPMLCNDIMQLRRGVEPQPRTGIATAAVEMAEAKIAKGENTEAESLLRGCLVIQEVAFPEGGWRIAETTSILGTALAAQQRFNEAESLLLDAHAGMENDPEAPEKRTHKALTRIVNLYEAWNKPQLADQWRARPTARQASRDAMRSNPQP